MTDAAASADTRVDVVILGGGLAGLTLALQLRDTLPDLDVLILERKTLPWPEAAHKVGESTVEIGAHYFADVLGLRQHLQEQHLPKFGFRFFCSEGRRDLDQVTEIGASHHLSVPSYQIDRGIFENFLAAEVQRRGARFVDSAAVRSVELADDESAHGVTYVTADERRHVRARWVVDASGRAGLIKRKLDLAEGNDHEAHAVWFRISDRITIDDWVDDEDWQARCNPRSRWLSTNHLVGEGYWVWLIPLSSGSHSVGIVADSARHPLATMDSFPRAMEWLREHQPRLFDDLDGKRDRLQDFAYRKRFSYGCKQVFSAHRWALTGEAGLFLDPFYSPGSDFIAIGNTYITELVERDWRGEPLRRHAQTFDQLYRSFYRSTLALYTHQYPIFGDPEVLPVKVIWDYTYYWGIMAQLFFHRRLADLDALAELRGELAHCQRLNEATQTYLRQWSTQSTRDNPAVMHDQASLPWFAELNRSLNDELDDDAFARRIRASHQQLCELAREILATSTERYPHLDPHALRAALAEWGDRVASANTAHQSLLPGRQAAQ